MTNQNSSMLEEMKIKHVMANRSLSIQTIKSKMPPLLLQSSHPYFFFFFLLLMQVLLFKNSSTMIFFSFLVWFNFWGWSFCELVCFIEVNGNYNETNIKLAFEITVNVSSEWNLFSILFCNWCLCGQCSSEHVLHYFFWMCYIVVWWNA